MNPICHHTLFLSLTILFGCDSSGTSGQGDEGGSSGSSGSTTSSNVGGGGQGGAGSAGGGSTSSGGGGATPTKPIYVIGGQDQRHIVSEDGSNWIEDTYIAPNGADNAYAGGAVGNGAIVLTGDPGVLRSTDGHTWTSIVLPEATSLHSSKVVAAAGVFVMVSGNHAFKSSDGLTWAHAGDTGDAGHWQAIAYGNAHWVAIGDGHVKASEDGLAWHDYNATPNNPQLDALAFGNGVFVGVGKANNLARIATSPDGVTWTEQAPVTTLYDSGFGGIAFGDGKFLASDCCNAFESTDGVTWTKRGDGVQGGIAFAGGKFVGAGWRTEARLFNDSTGDFESTLTGDQPNQYDSGQLAPWFTAVVAGEL